MKKFEIGKFGDIEKFDEWFDYCQKQQIPYIIIKNKTKYSSVEWDYISYNPTADSTLDLKGDSNQERFEQVYYRYCNPKSECRISNKVVFAKNISKEVSQKFAEEIFDIIYSQL